jgi:hypothetical protein
MPTAVRRGYTVEAFEEPPSWNPVPITCGHVHATPAAAQRCRWQPFGRDPRVVVGVLAGGVVVTARGAAAPPRPGAHLYQGRHPAEVELDADDRAHLYPFGGEIRTAVAEFSRASVTGHAFVRIVDGPDAGLELALSERPPERRVEITYRPGALVADLRRAA